MLDNEENYACHIVACNHVSIITTYSITINRGKNLQYRPTLATSAQCSGPPSANCHGPTYPACRSIAKSGLQIHAFAKIGERVFKKYLTCSNYDSVVVGLNRCPVLTTSVVMTRYNFIALLAKNRYILNTITKRCVNVHIIRHYILTN